MRDGLLFSKNQIRTDLKNKISSIGSREEKERKIISALTYIIAESKSVILYRADQFEVNLDPLIHGTGFSGKKFFFPRIENELLRFISPEGWKPGKYSIPEPEGNESILPGQADICIVPALGFNSDGYRLGRGGGYYDKSLSDSRPLNLVGLSFSELFPVDFSQETHDVCVGRLVLEDRIVFF